MSTPLKVVFAGTPDFAARHLQGLIDSPHRIVAVMSQPDRPSGRGKRLQPSPVKAVALDAELPIWQPASLKNADSEATLSRYHADILVVVAYGLILPAAILDIPRLGCLNVHASLLPRWRGAARSSARSKREIPRRASVLWRWSPAWIPAPCSSPERFPSAAVTLAARCLMISLNSGSPH